ncbi:kinase-like domain-containing protein [Glomus cerebriforme]|uniref:Kinase-like domain-containing protein n=1 Tax=Glomus cerebriforme TaxID=658196 RepID=A0A397SHM3_9GLOM|nr:kinase-like domain-containing protein [Glomus cerebriforme]RIA82281.1 kinase-like domain-containing protein [Glomus cerebriforme]
MTNIRYELVVVAFKRAFALIDHNIQNNLEKRHEFRKQIILNDETLTKDEKSETIRLLNITYDNNKIRLNEGTKRICETCQEECLATLYCKYCIRNFLKSNFSNWSSENLDIDNLIRNCQIETYFPHKITEWIPFNNLQNIQFLNKNDSSDVFIADWIDGYYNEWINHEKRLKRLGKHKVILKNLKNVESANKSWFDEGKSHLTISNKWPNIVLCYGLTKDPSNENYMLVMRQMDKDLRNYLQLNHHKITWKERINIVFDIVNALSKIHNENFIHKYLHSGNILYLQISQIFYVSDLRFCAPADLPLNSIYGNLPYIAPEVIVGKEISFASDVYSLAILMWEISSGQQPFLNYDHDYNLAFKILNGMRPKILPGTPLEYKNLMEQCWDADPSKRPDIDCLYNEILELKKLYQQIEQLNNDIRITNYYTNSNSSNSLVRKLSKVHVFKNLPDPKNATEEEQEAFHSDDNVPIKIDDIICEFQTEQYDFIFDNKNEGKGKSKRNFSNDDDDDDDDETNNKQPKKIKLNNNGDINEDEISDENKLN